MTSFRVRPSVLWLTSADNRSTIDVMLKKRASWYTPSIDVPTSITKLPQRKK
ncbi:hypothetical protein DFA_00448 [Cavenderia fasciculata]|uniref:Uncharacterized protein n=1 Tax=Cavenderia fasciculata TaxID=261658 RepID=F4PRY9_CACFS|nr:uncharacterized protein DFA_00448 [Cavenderia fasciculata]EGG20587.1 hypothetical protein DFA_00448 [Cavenderia fasciculata]|eukprot:XP_004358437.1 hypothetical protein DFA_00448 [Cavenderia fasciculata]